MKYKYVLDGEEVLVDSELNEPLRYDRHPDQTSPIIQEVKSICNKKLAPQNRMVVTVKQSFEILSASLTGQFKKRPVFIPITNTDVMDPGILSDYTSDISKQLNVNYVSMEMLSQGLEILIRVKKFNAQFAETGDILNNAKRDELNCIQNDLTFFYEHTIHQVGESSTPIIKQIRTYVGEVIHEIQNVLGYTVASFDMISPHIVAMNSSAVAANNLINEVLNTLQSEYEELMINYILPFDMMWDNKIEKLRKEYEGK